MSLYNQLHSLIFRAKEFRDATGLYKAVAQLKREQYLSQAELEKVQIQRLRRILQHAREHSPYYRDVLDRSGIAIDDNFGLAALSGIPPLTREDLQEHLGRILCDDAAGHYHDSSGGSTGQPVSFYHDQNYHLHSRANDLLFLSWMGIRPGDKTAVFWGADRDLQETSRYARWMNRINRVKQLDSFSMTDETVAHFIDEINRFKPRYVYGYASSLYHVARFINEREPIRFQPAAVRSSAEALYDFQRREIEKAFGARVYDFYGSREVNNIAAECSAHEGLHIFASGRIVEILDDRGLPVSPGSVGNIAVTDLTNFYFPFVRYLNGDMASLKETACRCGRTYPLLEKICGRSSDMIVIDGEYVHGEYFTHLFYGRPEIAQFQLVQEAARVFKLYVVARTDNPDLDFFRKALIEKAGDNVDLEVILTDRIEPSPSGKHRFTISKLRPGRSKDD